MTPTYPPRDDLLKSVDLTKLVEKVEDIYSFLFSHKPFEKNLANRVQDLEQEITEICQRLLDLECKENPKNPYKCPTCDGKGSHQEEVEPKVLKFEMCHPCEGKGIVWG